MNKRQELIAALDNCIDHLLEGETVSACLERYETLRAEVEPLLTVVAVARRADAVPARSPHAVVEAKADFLAAAASYRLKARREATRRPTPSRLRRLRLPRLSPRLAPAWMTTVVATLLVLVMLTGTTVVASARVLPGHPLYPVKLIAEQARLSLVLDPQVREARLEEFDLRRLQEANEVVSHGLLLSWGYLSGVVERMEEAEWTLGRRGKRVSVRLDERTEVEGEPALGARVVVYYYAPRPGELVARRIRILALASPPPAFPTPTSEPSPSPTPTRAEPREPTPVAPIAPAPTKHLPMDTPELPETPRPEHTGAPPKLTETPSPTDTATATPTDTLTPTATASPTSTDTPTPEPTPTPPRPMEVRFDGIITSMKGNIWIVGGRSIRLSGETERLGRLVVGARVTVVAERRDGVLVAKRIILRDPVVRQEFSDFIEDIQGEVWKVGGRVLRVPSALISGDAPQVGCLAHVALDEWADGSVVVISVVVECLQPVQFEGVIESISGHRWQVGGWVVIVSGDIVEGEPEVGRWAEVEGYERADGAVLATHIRVLEPTATPTVVAAAGVSASATATPYLSPTSVEPTAGTAVITPTPAR